MKTIEVLGRINQNGELEAVLPPGLPSGTVRVSVTFEDDTETVWTEAELDSLLTPTATLDGQAIVEMLENLDRTGWEDVEDGATWTETQRRQHREQTQW